MQFIGKHSKLTILQFKVKMKITKSSLNKITSFITIIIIANEKFVYVYFEGYQKNRPNY